MRIWIIIFVVFIPTEIFPQSSPVALFELLSPKQSGVNFKNDISESEELNVLSYEYFYNGGGVAVGDINNDGLLDLYFTANMKADKLFLNLGNLKFKDITKQAGILSTAPWKTGVTMADVNSDGWLDIYVCYSGQGNADSRRNKLYLNNGNLSFTESAKKFNLDDSGYSTQAAFFDYDRDGDLDMYLMNHNIKDYKDVELIQVKTAYDSLAADRLYQNNHGVFKDVSREAGISGNPISFGLGLTISDINSDGWQDIYVSNDYREHDYLYLNNQDGTFKERVKNAFEHISEFSMGNDVADFNNDGLVDVVTMDMLPADNRRQKLLQGPENYELHQSLVKNGFHYQFMRNMLQLNNGNGTFSEIGQLAGVSNTDWSWTPLFADFDNDGWKDLFVTNGYLRDYTNKDFLKYWGKYLVERASKMEKTLLMDLVTQMPSTKMANYIFRNQGDLTFQNTTTQWGIDQSVLSSGAIFGDLDNDGDLEIISNNVNENAFIYRNLSQENLKKNYLQVLLSDKTSANHLALGSKVLIYTASTKQLVEVQPVRGYQSSASTVVHFGLGNGDAIDSMIIEWPDGSRQKMSNVTFNQRVHVEKKSAVVSLKTNYPPVTYFEHVAPDFTYQHRDLNYNDFKRQPLMPFMRSYVAPIMAQGDVNGDGFADLFVGGSRGKASVLLLQRENGAFEELPTKLFNDDIYTTTTDAAFVDLDRDGDLDLYAVSGGYHEFDDGNVLLADRIYLNDGAGNFTERKKLPYKTSKSSLDFTDLDNDGDVDIFVGGMVVPGKYPKSPRSYILINDGQGNFEDATERYSKELKFVGMVRDCKWADLNRDGKEDLIFVGDYMPVRIFMNGGAVLVEKTAEYFDDNPSGFFSTLAVTDLDQDGDVEILVGNVGLNTQLKASLTEPIDMVYSDFDNNGSIDPFLCMYNNGKSYPYVTRDELLDQIYGMRKKFTSYKSYADATLSEIFTADELKAAEHLQVRTLETTLFENVNDKFKKRALPLPVQFSVVQSLCIADLNHDGLPEVMLFGNDSHARLKLGKIDANFGTILLNKGKCEFDAVPASRTGLNVTGDVKSAALMTTPGKTQLILGINNRPVSFYKLKLRAHDQ